MQHPTFGRNELSTKWHGKEAVFDRTRTAIVVNIPIKLPMLRSEGYLNILIKLTPDNISSRISLDVIVPEVSNP